MYTEDKIFGPLTLKQFIIAISAIGIIYILHTYFQNYVTGIYEYIVYGVIGVVALSYVAHIKPKFIPREHMDNYLNQKRAELGNEKYVFFLKTRLTNLLTEIEIRKAKHFGNVSELEDVAEVLRKKIGEVQPQ